MEETVIPLLDRRLRMLNAQDWVGQGAAAVALLTTGVGAIRGEGGTPAWLAWADVAVGVFLLRAIARDVRAARHARYDPDAEQGGEGLGWTSLLGAAACFLQWGARLHTGGKALSPVMITGVVNLFQGLMAPYFGRRRREKRSLRLGPAGVDLRLSAVKHFQAGWEQLSSVTWNEGGLVLAATDGRTCRLPARRYDNFARIAETVVEQARACRVPVVAPAQPRAAAP